jgi:NADH:ubiquinone oxidoreductase subunit K
VTGPLAQFWGIEAFSVAALLALGLFCVVGNKNTIKILMGIAVMTRSVSLAFILGGAVRANMALAQSMAVTIIVVDAAITALCMAMIVNIYKHYGTVETDKLNRLNG